MKISYKIFLIKKVLDSLDALGKESYEKEAFTIT